MFEVWERKGTKSILLARFKLEKDAQAHLESYRGQGEVEVRVPSQPPKRPSKNRFVAAKEHDDEFIADDEAKTRREG